MSAINAAYRVLSDPRLRAAYDARRFLRPVVVAPAPQPVRAPAAPVVRRAATASPRAERMLAIVGVLVLITIAAYAVVAMPRAERDAAHPSGSVPERLRSDRALRSFPGTVLVPPSDLAPFKDLPILRLDATGQGIARYAVYYGDLTTGVASISGLTGREAFNASMPRLPDCAVNAGYCAGPAPRQAAADAPGLELFRSADLVANFPAFVTHRVCCNGVFWTVSWFEPGANVSYSIDLSRNVAAQFGSPMSDRDVAAARRVASLATQLVRLP